MSTATPNPTTPITTTPTARPAIALLAGLCLTALATLAPRTAHAQQVSFDQGIELVTVGNPGNAPWTGGGALNNRGRVDYEYRIGRYEVTTAQWAEFMNAAFDRPQNEWIPHIQTALEWDAVATTPNTPGGRRWDVPAGVEMRPVGGVSWRMAAIYCNWLHNGRSTARESFLSGAYEVSTFVPGQFGWPSDQFVRSSGARFYIPSASEWMKAAHYDPHKQNPDGSVGGWWQFGNRTDTPLTYGPPGVTVNGIQAQANAAWSFEQFPGFDPFAVPLGAYTQTVSAYGLYDVAGGSSEHVEDPILLFFGGQFQLLGRFFDGSARTGAALNSNLPGDLNFDSVGTRFSSLAPWEATLYNGFRVAAVIPTPSVVGLIAIGTLFGAIKRRRDA